jgi:signal transduction histidine kinase
MVISKFMDIRNQIDWERNPRPLVNRTMTAGMPRPLLGPSITLLAVILLLEGVGHNVLHEAVFFGFSAPIFLLALVYFTVVDGMGAGLACLAITLAYYGITLSPLDLADLGRLALIGATFPAVVSMVGVLERRLGAAALEKARLQAYSERVEAEVAARTRDLQEANRRLQELDRLKDNVLDNVTHELRTPLATIGGYAELLEDGLGGDLTREQAHFVGEIQQATCRLEGLVSHLLDVTRLESGAFALVRAELDLRDEVAKAVEAQRPFAQRRGVALAVAPCPELLVVPADPRCVATVLACLLDNALAFTPRGGQVVVTCRREGEQARVEVRDSGPGIAPEHLPRVWEKFYQVDAGATREHGGAGLGLSISKAMVEAHGGQVGASSVMGQGATFWFTLPA